MELTEQKIREIVRQEIKQNASNSRFNLQSINNHTHNGIDSKNIFNPVVNYIGIIPGDIDDPQGTLLLPQGWSVGKIATGIYQIFHNLGSIQYAASLLQTATALVDIGFVSVDIRANDVIFYIQDGGHTLVDLGFCFVMTQVNNTSTRPVQYTGRRLNLTSVV